MNDVIQAMAEVVRQGGLAAVATVTASGGSTPQRVGAKLLLTADGRTVGTGGGGRIERVVLEALGQCIEDGKAVVRHWHLDADLGMCCGGRMEVFIEPVRSGAPLWLFGAGHVGAATAVAAAAVGFAVTVVDERPELNTAERFPGCQRRLEPPDEVLREAPRNGSDWLLIITHDHRLDEQLLLACLQRPHRYVGMIGSKRKVLRIVDRLRARHGALDTSRLYAPVGLDLGAQTPAEIAISIVAELVALRRDAPGVHMRLPQLASATQPVSDTQEAGS